MTLGFLHRSPLLVSISATLDVRDPSGPWVGTGVDGRTRVSRPTVDCRETHAEPVLPSRPTSLGHRRPLDSGPGRFRPNTSQICSTSYKGGSSVDVLSPAVTSRVSVDAPTAPLSLMHTRTHSHVHVTHVSTHRHTGTDRTRTHTPTHPVRGCECPLPTPTVTVFPRGQEKADVRLRITIRPGRPGAVPVRHVGTRRFTPGSGPQGYSGVPSTQDDPTVEGVWGCTTHRKAEATQKKRKRGSVSLLKSPPKSTELQFLNSTGRPNPRSPCRL